MMVVYMVLGLCDHVNISEANMEFTGKPIAFIKLSGIPGHSTIRVAACKCFFSELLLPTIGESDSTGQMKGK
jgi:hypothetical protein